jgi:tetratricopeptide (TPR) repeat protein
VLGSYSFNIEGDLATGLEYLGEALKIGVELNDIVTVVLSKYWMAADLSCNCEFDQALAHLDKCLEISTAASNPGGMAEIKSSIAFFVYGFQGKAGLAYQTSLEAIRLAEESGDAIVKAQAYTSHGYSCYYKGYLDEAETNLLKAIDFCDRMNYFLWGGWANCALGEVYFYRGEYQKCQPYYDKGISLVERVRWARSFTIHVRVGLARAKVLSNEKDIDLESLYMNTAENKFKVADGMILRYIAEILFNIDDQHVPEAEDWVRKAIEADKRNGTMCELGTDYAFYANLLKRKGDLAGAKEKLGKAIEIYRECGADGWLKNVEQELAELQNIRRKQPKQAKK